MFEAQLLYGGSGSGVQVFSPWFPRQGDNAVFTLDVIQIVGTGAEISVTAFTKNSEDVGDGEEMLDPGSGTAITITRTVAEGTGRESNEWEALTEELVRYRFVVKNSSTDWVLFRMLPPVWFDSVHSA